MGLPPQIRSCFCASFIILFEVVLQDLYNFIIAYLLFAHPWQVFFINKRAFVAVVIMFCIHLLTQLFCDSLGCFVLIVGVRSTSHRIKVCLLLFLSLLHLHLPAIVYCNLMKDANTRRLRSLQDRMLTRHVIQLLVQITMVTVVWVTLNEEKYHDETYIRPWTLLAKISTILLLFHNILYAVGLSANARNRF